MSIQSTEDKIKADWNAVRAWVATHQTISLTIVGGLLWCAGHFHIPF